MPGPALTTEAFVLLKHPPAESFQALIVFSPEQGALRVLQRVPRRPSPQHLPLDLFDEVVLTLEAGSSGTWFLKEGRLVHRHTEIGRRYDALQGASTFARLIARNPVHDDSRPAVYRLLRTAFSAFATSDRPDVVAFKSWYCFARDEGHPLKQQWVPTLPAEDRADVQHLLTQPVAEQTAPPKRVAHLQRRLEEYLRGHTEIWVGGEERGS